jgi:hypothetical protein
MKKCEEKVDNCAVKQCESLDDLGDVVQDLGRHLNKDWKRECGQHVSRPDASRDRGATPRRRMANIDKGMEDPGEILI